ncbi:hypothetical protein FOZ63_012948 [Perkinsus olseni]|uniref:Reverse transcriptase domain-containing protein n=1 Tax=Perkinsus olseni TaxID=32597 RepID=A0A7J6TR40_PEROL|nr:hypothetical protein FOZ63_012948 [Perkinsus olseni]
MENGSPILLRKRRRPARSQESRKRRNARKRDLRFDKSQHRGDYEVNNDGTGRGNSRELADLQYYAHVAALRQSEHREEVIDGAVDGTGMPEVCQWYPYPATQPQATEKLREQLEGWIDTLAGNSKLRDLFDQWVALPRDRQGSCTQFPDLLDEMTKRASEQLRETWCLEIGVSGEAAPNTSLRPELMKALLMATSDHPDREDVGICDEVSRGCRVGIHEPIAATGLWPKDTKGPKHKGYGLSFWASKEAWYNYKSCEEMKSQVCAELEAEVVKGRMKKTTEPPAGAHLTKIACILKPNGKVRLVDDLRRSGINELVLCDETLALPGLKSAALAVEIVSSQAPPGAEILWLETDVAAAFRNIPVSEEDQCFLVNKVGDYYYVHTVLPFGLRSSPLLWCRYSANYHKLVKRLLPRSIPCDGIIYVDDSGWAVPREHAFRHLLRAVLIAATLGIPLSHEKMRLSTTPHNLGFRWSLSSKIASVPEEKTVRIINDLDTIINIGRGKHAPTKLIEGVTGRLTWLSQILPKLNSDLQALYALQNLARRRNGTSYL